MIWKDIKGYEGSYQASDSGLVRSLPRKYRTEVKILKQTIGTWGYPVISIKGRQHPTHIIIAECFLGPRPHLKVINHKNGIKTDARVENLEYISPTENYAHAAKNHLCANKYKQKRREDFKEVANFLIKKGFKKSRIAWFLGVHCRTIFRIAKISSNKLDNNFLMR